MAYIYRSFHLAKSGKEKNYNFYLVIKMERTTRKKRKVKRIDEKNAIALHLRISIAV